MPKEVRLITLAVMMAVAAIATASHAQDGTITPGNPLVTYTRGPFTGANPSNNVTMGEPDCDFVPNQVTCSDFALRVTLPAGYQAANPTHVVSVKIQWNPANPADDFDLYCQDAATGISQPEGRSATSANPEVAIVPAADGNRDYRIRVLHFSVANVSYNATISLGGPPVPGVGTYLAGTDTWSCNAHLVGPSMIPGPPPTTFDHSNDGEPSVKIDPNGRAYTTAIAGVPAGAGLWATSDACGQAIEWLGAVDAGAGGGDSDVEVASAVNPLGNYNVYLSSLTLANITTAASFDGGATYVITPVSTPAPVDDRQWNAAWGSSIVYLSYRNGATQPGNFLEVVRMDYTGMGAPVLAGPFNVWDPTLNPPTTGKQLGNMVADKRALPAGSPPLLGGPDGEGNVYHGFTQNNSQVWVAKSTTFGVTWTNHLVFDGGAGANYAHLFTWVAVDSEGNVYTVWADASNVYYSASTDQALTWSSPVRVNAGAPNSRTCVFPHIAAGSGGRIVVSFYGHNLTGQANPNAVWKVFAVKCNNALSSTPTFKEHIVNNRNFHTGEVCLNGLGCACCRQLLECFDVDINPRDGSAFVTYGSFGGGGSYITRQVAGESSIASLTVTDRSGVCPIPPDCETVTCIGDACVCPGCIAVLDLDVDDTPPAPSSDTNIRAVGVGEPFEHPEGDSVLVFSVQLAGALNMADLPPNTFWRITFNPPAGAFDTYYVRVVNCSVGGLSGDYGHFTTGSVTDGPLDGFTLDPTGLICMYIDRTKVGSAMPGQQITGINADCRLVSGNCPGSPAAFAPLDVTNSGGYLVQGNAECNPIGVPDPEGTPANAFSFGIAGANPFSGETQVTYSLPEQARVRIDVYNVAGQRVATLVNHDQETGIHRVAFRPRAAGLGSGVYWLKMKAGGFEDQVRLVAVE